MEYTQWDNYNFCDFQCRKVLILVVMEYTQWVANSVHFYSLMSLNPCCNGIYSMSTAPITISTSREVLILVVMEYTQWVVPPERSRLQAEGLNPCCNGIYSMSHYGVCLFWCHLRLNPCCNGIYSMSTIGCTCMTCKKS